jgi:hypothetical protein
MVFKYAWKNITYDNYMIRNGDNRISSKSKIVI